MNNSHTKRILIFSSVIGIAGIVALVVTFAGSEPQPYMPSGEREIPASLQPQEDIADGNAEAPATAQSLSTYGIPEWGITITGISANSHAVSSDSIALSTQTFEDLRSTSRAGAIEFENCYLSSVTLHRIERSQTTTNLNASPWWTVQQELETNGARAGNFYYFFKEPTDICLDDPSIAQLANEALQRDTFAIIKGISL